MSPAAARLAFAAVLSLNVLLWSQSRYSAVSFQPGELQLKNNRAGVIDVGKALWKRDLDSGGFEAAGGGATGDVDVWNVSSTVKQCHPLDFPLEEQCAHVLSSSCRHPRTFLRTHYLSSYFCTKPRLRPGTFTLLLIWLLFLFSTLGISASDFFTPNLATIAQLLGLDEDVAGVTFLAFGNGSPDVFSTFSAMRAGSGSLAIGELLGAATFIVSCVVGSMCIIKPFRVDRVPFLRDVGFFSAAVALLFAILWDGVIEAWEAGLLVLLYVVYVVVVVTWSWWERRRERRRRTEALVRSEYGPEEVPVTPFHDDEPYTDSSNNSRTPTLLVSPSPTRPRAASTPHPQARPGLALHTDLPQPHRLSRTPSPTMLANGHGHSPTSTPYLSQMPSFSLVGALEFRQVVASLQNSAASTQLSMFDSPITPYAGGHYYSRHNSRTATLSRSQTLTPRHAQQGSGGSDPWDAALGVPLSERESHTPQIVVTESPTNVTPTASRGAPSPVPTDATEIEDDEDEDDMSMSARGTYAPSKRQRLRKVVGKTYRILFPSLHSFRRKSYPAQVASLFAAPAVILLTLTLPVMVTPYDSSQIHEKGMGVRESGGGSAGGEEAERLIDFEEEGIERALIAEETVQEDLHEMKYNKYLMAAQCVLGPLFCSAVLASGSAHELLVILTVLATGSCVSLLVLVFSKRGDSPFARTARCSMGFVVAIVWIMAIADEVVEVLQTFGFLFGLSDAIIGLTVFAVGNSLADLVANMSVAVFAPIMGFSACFGGPMLNILLGVGISGTYIAGQTGEAYPLHFSSTLIVSSVGLLALLAAIFLVVPLSGYFLTRKLGFVLIACYFVLMTVNVVVELNTDSFVGLQLNR